MTNVSMNPELGAAENQNFEMLLNLAAVTARWVKQTQAGYESSSCIA